MYHIVCECGRYTTTQDLEGLCPLCRRAFRISWSDAKTFKERFYALFGDYAKEKK